MHPPSRSVGDDACEARGQFVLALLHECVEERSDAVCDDEGRDRQIRSLDPVKKPPECAEIRGVERTCAMRHRADPGSKRWVIGEHVDVKLRRVGLAARRQHGADRDPTRRVRGAVDDEALGDRPPGEGRLGPAVRIVEHPHDHRRPVFVGQRRHLLGAPRLVDRWRQRITPRCLRRHRPTMDRRDRSDSSLQLCDVASARGWLLPADENRLARGEVRHRDLRLGSRRRRRVAGRELDDLAAANPQQPPSTRRKERCVIGSEHVHRIRLRLNPEANADVGVGLDVAVEHPRRSLGRQHEVETQRTPTLCHVDQRRHEVGKRIDQRCQLVHHDDEAGEDDAPAPNSGDVVAAVLAEHALTPLDLASQAAKGTARQPLVEVGDQRRHVRKAGERLEASAPFEVDEHEAELRRRMSVGGGGDHRAQQLALSRTGRSGDHRVRALHVEVNLDDPASRVVSQTEDQPGRTAISASGAEKLVEFDAPAERVRGSFIVDHPRQPASDLDSDVDADRLTPFEPSTESGANLHQLRSTAVNHPGAATRKFTPRQGRDHADVVALPDALPLFSGREIVIRHVEKMKGRSVARGLDRRSLMWKPSEPACLRRAGRPDHREVERAQLENRVKRQRSGHTGSNRGGTDDPHKS